MNTRLLPSLTAAGLLAAGAASAQSIPLSENSDTDDVTLRGAVAAGCRMDTPSAPTASNAEIEALGPGSADIAISQLVDETGEPVGAVVVLELPAVCNQAHTLNLVSLNGALQSDGPPVTAGPFRSSLPYQVTVAWGGGAPQVFQSLDEALEVVVGEAISGAITLTIQIPAGGDPLAAGAYADELILELGVAG